MAPDSTESDNFYGLPNLTEKDFDKVTLRVARFVAEYDISQLNTRVQVRTEKHTAPASRVAEYAARMKNEATPPILVTLDHILGDGNTRVAAARKNKRQFLPAVVIDSNYEDADEKTQLRIQALCAKANRHGEPLDKAEKRRIVSECVRQGWTQAAIGLYVGVTPAVVAQINEEIKAVKKLEKVGISANGDLGSTSLRALGKISDMNDEPFREIVNLAREAGLNSNEIKDLGKRAKDTGSDAAALTVIKSDREQNAERIAELKLTGTAKPPMPRQLRQHLGFLTKHKDAPD